MKISIVSPSVGFIDTLAASTRENLITHLIGSGHQIMALYKQNSLLPRNREELLEESYESGADYVLMMDADQVFPAKAIDIMLSRNEKDAIISANVVTGNSLKDCRFNARSLDDKQVKTTKESEGLEEVAKIGTGVVLIPRPVLEKTEAPRFEVHWIGQHYLGEDYYFSKRMRSYGIKLYVDHCASKLIGHRKSVILTYDMVGQ